MAWAARARSTSIGCGPEFDEAAGLGGGGVHRRGADVVVAGAERATMFERGGGAGAVARGLACMLYCARESSIDLSAAYHSMRDLMADMAMRAGLSRDRMAAAKGVLARPRGLAGIYMGGVKGLALKKKCRS